MCGICGLCDFQKPVQNTDILQRMRDIMICRGPDDSGSFVNDGIALGHRRLAIIDLTEAGHQPMTNEDCTTQIVFNGEIYNFQSLRKALDKYGHEFKSNSDTEVLVHGYEQWGIDGLATRIRGMFAFAIWDEKLETLFLVRDHLGKKPLFYKLAGSELSFSSDIKSLWLAHAKDLEINPEAIDEFLYYYFITQQRSIYKSISKLGPGHLLEFSSKGAQIRCYWKPNYSVKKQRKTSEWLELFDQRFRVAVKRRLVSDVPIGAFLSGGLDSSAVCAVMAEESNQKVKTFCAGFGDASPLDERIFARKVAERIGTEHIELEISADVSDELTRIIWHYGEPFADSSAIPSYLIAAEARKHVTVVLTGDGGDEGFAGYPRFLSAKRADDINSFIRKVGLPAFKLVIQSMIRIAPKSFQLRRLDNLHAYLSGARDAHARFQCVWDGFRSDILGTKVTEGLRGFHPVLAQKELLNSLSGQTKVDHSMEYVLRQRLPSDYLTKIDVATMAHSLEARSPFLDVDLLELAMQIPVKELLKNGQTKALIKEYLANWLPPELIHRKKAGFEVPISDWFRTQWYSSTRHLLLEGVAVREGYFNHKAVGWLLDKHQQGKSFANQIWSLLVFEIWLRLFVECTLKPGDRIIE